MHWGWAILGGLGGATLVVGLFAWQRSKSWEERAALARQALQARGSNLELALTSSGEKLREELTAEGRRLAESAARAEAERIIGLEYGLTRERIESLQRVYQRIA